MVGLRKRKKVDYGEAGREDDPVVEEESEEEEEQGPAAVEEPMAEDEGGNENDGEEDNRSDDDDDDDDDEHASEEETDDDDDQEEEEEQQQQQALTQKRRAVKKKGGPGTKQGNEGRRKMPGKTVSMAKKNILPPLQVRSEFSGNTALLVSLRRSQQDIVDAARDWLQRYREGRAQAAAEAATFLMQACGLVSIVVSAEEIEHHASDEIRDKAAALAEKDGLEDVLGGRGGKQVKQNYRELWDNMIREAGKSEQLSDCFFLEKIIDLSIALSTSPIREFRRVATMTAAQISISLLVVIANLNEMREMSSDQAANVAKNTKKGKESASAFEQQVQKASQAIKELLCFVDSVFQSVFTTRFRDIDSEIRATIIDGLGRWMMLYPSSFLNTTYLKYLAWALSDKDAVVRHAAVCAILRLYEDEKNTLHLRDFTNRFSDRMIELMEDKDDTVAAAGIDLVTLLVKKQHLSADCGRQVFNLLSDPSPKLRNAAAELAAGMINDVGKKAIKGSRKAFNKKGKKGQKAHDATDSESELAGVLSVLRSLSSTGEEQSIPLPETIVFFVVSSLSHRVSALSNWHLMVDWLLNDVAFNILGEDSTLDLAKCFLCAVKSSADPSRVKGVTKEKRKAIDSAKQEVTLLLQKELPNLLIKFQSEPDLLATVCRVIPYMKIELYSLKRQEASLATLLGTLKDSFFRHADLGCLSSCAHALAHCSRLGKDNVKDIAISVLGETVTQVSRDMAEAVKCMNKIGFVEMGKLGDHYRETNGTEGSVELFQICSAFARASAIEEAHPMAFVDDESAQTSLRTLLRLASEGWDIPAKAVFDAERSLLLLLLSNLAMYNHQDSDQSKGDALAEARIDLTSRMHAIIETAIGSGYKDVAITTAGVLADLFLVFSSENLPDHCQHLAYVPLDEEVDSFWHAMELSIGKQSIYDDTMFSKDLDIPLSAVHLIARICGTGSIPQYRQLASKLLSYWESPDIPGSAADVFKDLLRKLKSLDATSLPEVYLNAMRLSYARYRNGLQSCPEEEQAEKAEELIEPFLLLSHKIAHSQASLNAPISTLEYIAEKGAIWAVENAPDNLEFLQGASYFVVKVKGESASSILQTLEKAGRNANAPPDSETEDIGDWELYYEYCDVLRAQSSKQKDAGCLKKNKSTPVPNRRISFALDDGDAPPENLDMDTATRRRSSRLTKHQSPSYKEKYSDDEDDFDERENTQLLPTEEQLP